MIPVQEMHTAAEVYASAKRLRGVFYGPRQAVPTQVKTASEMAAIEAGLSPETQPGKDLFPAVDLDEAAFAERLALWLASEATPSLANHTTARELVRGCAEHHGLTPNDIIGGRRKKEFVKARHEAMAAVYVMLWPTWSLPKIANFFGGRHHTTIMHAAKKMGVWKAGVE